MTKELSYKQVKAILKFLDNDIVKRRPILQTIAVKSIKDVNYLVFTDSFTMIWFDIDLDDSYLEKSITIQDLHTWVSAYGRTNKSKLTRSDMIDMLKINDIGAYPEVGRLMPNDEVTLGRISLDAKRLNIIQDILNVEVLTIKFTGANSPMLINAKETTLNALLLPCRVYD